MTIKPTIATTFTEGNPTTGIPLGQFGEVTITGLQSDKFYKIKGYAINLESNTIGAALTEIREFQTVQPNTVTFNSTSMPTTIVYNMVEIYEPVSTNIYKQGVKKSITIPASYNSTNASQPAPTGSNSKGIVYIVQDIGVTAPTNPTVDNSTVIYSNTPVTGTTYTTTIPITTVVANKVYYIRAFTINASGPGYSDLITITSGVDLPTLDTTIVTTTNLTGNLLTTGGSVAMERGFIISSSNTIATTGRPSLFTTLSNGIKLLVDTNPTTGTFTTLISTISGLTPATTYYVSAYAYNTTYNEPNCNAFAYSPITTFTSVSTAPGITTNAVLPLTITENGATLTGAITNTNGGTTITDSGFVYTIDEGDG